MIVTPLCLSVTVRPKWTRHGYSAADRRWFQRMTWVSKLPDLFYILTLESFMSSCYDLDVMMAQAREWREAARTAPPELRSIYLSRADECEAVVQRSLCTPPISEKQQSFPGYANRSHLATPFWEAWTSHGTSAPSPAHRLRRQ